MLELHPDTPTIADIQQAALRIKGLVVETPLLESSVLNEKTGGRVLVKAECLQTRGSFKLRGASNALAVIPPSERERGVVAFSSGNHAQGVALAARRLGIPTTIIVPRDAPVGKIAAARADGARIIAYDRQSESREAIGARIADETGAKLIKPFDDPLVIAGQGTIGMEVLDQAKALGVDHIDQLVCCVGGGGLFAGISLALRSASLATRMTGVEPEGHDDLARSLISGQRERNAPGIRSICDALLSEMPGEFTAPMLMAVGARGVCVSDDEVLDAMAFAFTHFKIVLEPGGAVALTAVLAGKVGLVGKNAVVIASGGNVDAAVFARALSRL